MRLSPRRAAAAVCAALSLAFVAGEARAQCSTLNPPCTNQAPFVSLTPISGTFSDPTLLVEVGISDDSGINYASFVATLNGAVLPQGATGSAGSGSTTLTLALTPGTNTLQVVVCDVQGACSGNTGTYTYAPVPPPQQRGPATLSLAPYHDGVRTVSPFDRVVTYSTPAYVSMDVPRSATLVYTSSQAEGRAYLQVDAIDNSTEPPTAMSIQVMDAAGNVVAPETFYWAGSGRNRLAATWTAAGLPTGAYTYTVQVRTWWGTDSRVTSVPVRVLHLNESDSRMGAGFSVAGFQRLHARGDSMMVVNGDGTAAFFARTSATTFRAPDGEFSTLSWDGSVYRRRWPDGTEAVFSQTGYLQWVRDRFGRQTTFHWTATTSGRQVPWRVVDPVGKELTFAYTGGEYLFSITDPSGRASQFWQNAAKETYLVRTPDGVNHQQFSYGAGHRLTRVVDRDQGQWDFTYDPVAAKALEDSLPAVAVEGVGTVRPVVRTRSWEAAFLPPPGTGTAQVFAPARLLPDTVRATVTDPRGAMARMALDRFFLPTVVSTPLGDSTLTRRNQHGQPTRVQDPAGAVTEYQWEAQNLVRAHELETGLVTEIGYSYPHNQVQSVSSGGYAVVHEYGTLGQLLKTKVGTDSTTYGYAADWRLAWTRDPGGHRTDVGYESTGFRNTWYVRESDPATGATRQVSFGYDGAGRPASVTSGAGTVQHRYDALNRDTAVVGPTGTTRFAYAGSFLTRVDDPAGKIYNWGRNPLGWLQWETDPQNRLTSYGYDRAGNVARVTDRRGLSVTFTHDSIGRVLTRTADGAVTTYAYDPAELWVAAQNAVSIDTLHFDKSGRMTGHVAWLGGRRYERAMDYHDEGPRKTLSYWGTGVAGRTWTYGYNHKLQLTTITGSGGVSGTTSLQYDPDGLPTSITLPNGLVQTFTHTPTHLPERERWSATAVDNALGRRYVFDHLDRLFSAGNAQETSMRRYDHDAASRLVGVSNWGKVFGELICEDPSVPSTCFRERVWAMQDTLTHGYDAVGNRTDAGASLQPYSNRYATFRGYSFTYDDEGNLTQKQGFGYTQTLTWNALGQLASVTASPSGASVSYGYNGFGQRVRRTWGGSVTYYIYDDDDLLMEVNENGTLVREYSHYPGVDDPHGLRTPLGVYYYGMEYPGHVTGLVNGSGQVTHQYRYTPWGEVESISESETQPLRYMARELDPTTGLYYVRNRWYDPVLARFVSEDPIGLAGGINPYAYVGNSPTNLRDPSGLNPSIEACIKQYKEQRNKGTRYWTDKQIEKACGAGGGAISLAELTVTHTWMFSTDRSSGLSLNFGLRPSVPGGMGWGLSFGGGDSGGPDSPAESGVIIGLGVHEQAKGCPKNIYIIEHQKFTVIWDMEARLERRGWKGYNGETHTIQWGARAAYGHVQCSTGFIFFVSPTP